MVVVLVGGVVEGLGQGGEVVAEIAETGPGVTGRIGPFRVGGDGGAGQVVDFPALPAVREPAPPDLDMNRPGLPLIERQRRAGIGATGQFHRPYRPGYWGPATNRLRFRCRGWKGGWWLGWRGRSLGRRGRRGRRGRWWCGPLESPGSHEPLVGGQGLNTGLVGGFSSTLMASGSGQGPARLQPVPGGSAL